jgi:Leucine-rich repeat (LRR) protein
MAFIPTSHLGQVSTGYGAQNQALPPNLQPHMSPAVTNTQSSLPNGNAGVRSREEANNPSPFKRARIDNSAFQSEGVPTIDASILSHAATLTDAQESRSPLIQTRQITITNSLYLIFPENMDFFKERLFLDISQMDNYEIQRLAGEVLNRLKLQIEKSGPASFKETTHMQLREDLSYEFFVNDQKKDFQGFYLHLCEFARSVLHNNDLRFYEAYRCYRDWREQILREVSRNDTLEEQSKLSHFTDKLTLLPREITRLRKVRNLDLSGNRLLDFPKILLTLESVQKLTLSGNSISTLPIGFRNLNCEKLNLSENEFSSFPEEATHNQHIKKLDLSGNDISDLPEGVKSMAALEELYLDDTNIPLSEAHQDIKRELDQKGVICTGYPNLLAWFQTDEVELFSQTDDSCEEKIINLIDSSHSSIYGMEYLITSYKIASALIAAHQRGVEVKIVTDDKQAADSRSQIQRLERAEIQVKKVVTEGCFHHKTMIFDKEIIRGGSYNLSYAAQNKNHENLTFERNNPEKISRNLDQFYRYIS